MKNKQFLGLSIFMCILAFVFMVVSIFNADWAISLKGYYIVCISWIATSVFNLVRVLRDKEEGFPVGGCGKSYHVQYFHEQAGFPECLFSEWRRIQRCAESQGRLSEYCVV